MKGLIAAHSGLRYIVLILLLIAIVNALVNRKSGDYLKKDKMINLFTMIFIHIQLVLGLILYFLGPSVNFSGWIQGITAPEVSFFAVEHALVMIFAVILITLGRRKAEKQNVAMNRHKLIFRYYGLGLVLIFIAIPWPFIYEELGAGWF